ncbi:hypothetical protein COCNU_scaffold008225G000010 [Cocos nucifera]|nr:hypothetical protein [Cocos nucifera]
MWGRRLASLSSLLHKKASSSGGGLFSTTTEAAEVVGRGGEKQRSFARRAVPIVLISLTGGVALSALNDLAIFHGCTRGKFVSELQEWIRVKPNYAMMMILFGQGFKL